MFRDEDYSRVTRDVLDAETVELIMRYAFSSSSDKSSSSSQPDDIAPAVSSNPHLLLEPVKIELLKVATILIEHCSRELVDHRKDLIKFAWNHLKADDATTKHWAYANVCRFISAYDTPPKIILQVSVPAMAL